MTGSDPLVRVCDVFVAYADGARSVMALRGADLSVAAGERLVIEGPNGSGKSTLLRVITGEQSVVAGLVEVDGTALQRLGPAERRLWRARTVGFVDQHARRNLLPERKVADNVALQLRLTGTAADQAGQRARETLDRLGLAGLADRRVPELSGGEAQRVAICSAVAHGPRLVLADEPTGELDDTAAREVYALLSRIASDGTALVIVSHDPRAREFADRGVRIRDGRVAEQWRPSSPEVSQVADSRGWIRLPLELLAPGVPDAVVASRHPAGLVLRTAAGSDSPSQTDADARRGPGIEEPPAGVPTTALVEVSTGFTGRMLFRDLGLEVRARDWVAVRGPSGSGKSTLLSLLAGLTDPDSGTVRVAGQAWAGRSRDQRAELRRRWVAAMPQQSTVAERMTVAENLALTAAVRGTPAPAEVSANVLDRLGLTELSGQPASKLSGGERQRLCLARLLMSSAPILILDEPTSQQDEASAVRIVRALHDEVSAGRAVLVASHDERCFDGATATIALG